MMFEGVKTISPEVLWSFMYKPIGHLSATESILLNGLQFRRFDVRGRCQVWYGEKSGLGLGRIPGKFWAGSRRAWVKAPDESGVVPGEVRERSGR